VSACPACGALPVDQVNDPAQVIGSLKAALAFYRDGFEPYKQHKHLVGFAWRPKEALLDDCGETARAVLSEQVPA
jgi:hypothetical protein